jgi:hypothetical protein
VSCTSELIAIAGRHPCARVIVHDPPALLRRITALLYSEASIEFAGPLGNTDGEASRRREEGRGPEGF